MTDILYTPDHDTPNNAWTYAIQENGSPDIYLNTGWCCDVWQTIDGKNLVDYYTDIGKKYLGLTFKKGITVYKCLPIVNGKLPMDLLCGRVV